MVAIVGGSELGLNANSGKLLGAGGTVGSAGQGRAKEGVVVNAVTGNLVLQHQDEFVAGTNGGANLDILRTYNSLGLGTDDNGDNWRLGLSRKVYDLSGGTGANTAGSTVKRVDEDGSEVTYTYDTTKLAYISKEGGGAFDKLVYTASSQKWLWTDGTTNALEQYDGANNGRLFQLTDLDAKSVTINYSATGLVSSIVASNGDQVVISYSGNNTTQLQALYKDVNNPSQTKTLTSIRYEYDANRLSKVTVDLSPEDNSVSDLNTYVTSYTYDGGNRIASITQTDGSRLEFTYVQVGSSYRVRTVKDMRIGDNGQYSLYNMMSFDYDVANNQTLIIDGSGRQTFWIYNANGQVLSIRQIAVDGGLSSEVQYSYDTSNGANGNITSATDALGNTTKYGYDAAGNRILERDSMGNTITRTFGTRNELLSETTYTSVDPDMDGPQLPTGARTKYYVYDGNRNLRFTVSPEGRVVRYVMDAQWRVINETAFTDVLNPQSSQPTFLALLNWSISQKNKGLRTDYTYDLARGQLASSTRYTAVDADGILSGATTTNYIYDQAGRLLQTIDAANSVTQYTYDGLGRILNVVDAFGMVTATSYDDQHRSTTVQVDSGASWGGGSTTTRTYDEAGQLLTLEQGAADVPASTTSYIYDKRGNLVREIAANGASTYHIYDAASRLVADIDPAGAMTEYVYSDARIAAAGLTTTETLVYTSPGNIRLNLGLQAPQPNGAPLSAVVKTYANGVLLASTTVSSFTGTNPTTATLNNIDVVNADLLTIEFYQNGVLIGETAHDSISALKAQGFALYTSAGNTAVTVPVVATTDKALFRQSNQLQRVIHYAKPVKVGEFYLDTDNHQQQNNGVGDATTLRLDGAYDGVVGLRPTDPNYAPMDRVDYRFFDAAGRLTKTINPEGVVTENFYDGAGQLFVTQRSGTALTWEQLTALRATVGVIAVNDPNATLPSGLIDYRLTQYSYSADGLLIGTYVDTGGWTVNRYDATGQLTETLQRALLGYDNFGIDSIDDLHTYYLHDFKGQLTGVIDPAGYLTEYRYDAVGNKAGETRYATPATLSTIPLQLSNVRPLSNDEDRNVFYRYDGLNRLEYQFEYQGPVRADVTASTDGVGTFYYSYDANGRPAMIMHGEGSPYLLYNTVANADPATMQTQLTYRLYDRMGRVTAEISPANFRAMNLPLAPLPGETETELAERTGIRDQGLWTYYTYDVSGRLASRRGPVDTQGHANVTLYFYDGNGRLIDVVDSTGHVEQTDYNPFGEVESKKTFDVALPDIQPGLERSQLVPSNAALVHWDRFVYNGRGLLAVKVAGEGSLNFDGTSNRGIEQYRYNAFGEMIEHVVLSTGTTYVSEKYHYNSRGLVDTVTRDSGTGAGYANLTTTTLYDSFGRAIQVTDARGKIWKRNYDKLGRVIAVTDPNTPDRTITYDAFGRVIEQVDALQKHTTFTYDAPSRTLTTLTPEGITTVATTDAFGHLISLQDGRGNTATYTYDLDGQLLDVATPMGSGTGVEHKTNVYDAAHHLIQVTENGVTTAYTYDAVGRVLTRTVDPGSSGLAITTRTLYNLTGQNIWDNGADGIWTQDAGGTWTQTRYDLKGEVVAVIVDPAKIPDGAGGLMDNSGALNLRTEYAYDNRGNKVKVTQGAGSANPKITVYDYDKLGRRIAEHVDQAHLDITTAYTYDANDNVISRTDANGNITRYVYNDRNELVYNIDPTGAVTKTEYDLVGRATRVTAYADPIDPAGFTTTTGALALSDVEGKLTSAILNNPANQVSYTIYDTDGRVRFEIDAAKSVTEHQYDGNGNVIRTTRYADAITVTGMPGVDGVKNAIEQSNTHVADNRVDYAVYDKANRKTFAVDADGYVTQWIYDTNGRVVKQTQYWGKLAGSIFDGSNTVAPVLATGSQPSGPYIVLSTASDRILRMFYDAAGRVRFTVDGEGYVTEHRYDPRGLEIARVSYAANYRSNAQPITDADTYATMAARFGSGLAAGDTQLASVYDAAGRLDTNYIGDAGGNLSATHHLYDATGRETDTISDYGMTGQSTVRRIYDAAGRLTDEYAAYGTPDVTHVQYVLDKMGNRVRVIDPNGNTGYFYFDGANRNLLQVDPEGFATRTVYTTFGTAKEIIHYANRVQGSLSSMTLLQILAVGLIPDNDNDQHTHIQHDVRNRQTKITDAENGVESMAYDALGNKVSYTNKLNGTFTYTYDHRGNVLTETAPATIKAKTTATAPDEFNPGAVKTYQYDARGNLSVLKENSAAASDQSRTTNFSYDLENRQVKKTGILLNVIGVSGSVVPIIPTETRKYDARGNLIEVAVWRDNVRANDIRTLYYYDGLNRKVAQIDPSGALTAWNYTHGSKPVSEIRYSVIVTLPSSAGGTPPTVSVDPNLRQTDYTYDGNGRLLTSSLRNVTIGEQVNVNDGYSTRKVDVTTTNVYDGNGNVIQVTDGRGNPETGRPGYSTYSYYNKLNQLVMVVDQSNYVTTWTRDASGNVLAETRYATALTAAPSATVRPAPPPSSPDDRIEVYTYDRMSRVLTRQTLNVKYGSSTMSQLIVESMAAPADAIVELKGNTTYAAATTFITTVTTGSNSDGRALVIGVDNNGAGSGARQLSALFQGDQLYAQYRDSLGEIQTYLLGSTGTIEANTAYRVKIEATANGPKLTVTAQNAQQTSWTYTSTVGSWSGWRVYGSTKVGPNRGIPGSRDGVGPLQLFNATGGPLLYEDFSTASSVTFSNNNSGALGTGRAELIGAAKTAYQYNALGQITKETQTSNAAAGTDEVTDITYDVLGRRISEQSPNFVDYLVHNVRPQTNYAYNGLNQVIQETKVHDGNDTAATDRITTYTYTNGRLVSQKDATNAEIRYAYDGAGNIMKKTLVGRTNADYALGVIGAAAPADDVTLYQYDAAGREVMHKDVGSGEVRGTRYNAFGEITGHRLGGTYTVAGGIGSWDTSLWQEQAEYNVQGKAWRTNSGDGAYKVYVFDANGNATLTVESAGADLATQSLEVILGIDPTSTGQPPVVIQTNLTISVYDGRNQLIDTYQPTMTADNRTSWLTHQVFTQPAGAPYKGGALALQNTVGSLPTSDDTHAMSSLPTSTIYVTMGARDQDTRGGESTGLFKPTERTIYFWGVPDYSAYGFNKIQIDFVLDRWYQPGGPDPDRNTYLGYSVSISADAGTSSISQPFNEPGFYDDDRNSPIKDAPNRTGHFTLWAYNSATGAKIQVGSSNLNLTVDTYFNEHHRDYDRSYHLTGSSAGYTVGGNQLTFKLPTSVGQMDTLTLWTRRIGTNEVWSRWDVPPLMSGGGRVAGYYVLPFGPGTANPGLTTGNSYEYFYYVNDALGNVRTTQQGSITLSGSGGTTISNPQPIGLPGYYLAGAYGLEGLLEQGSSLPIVKYRRVGAVDWVTPTVINAFPRLYAFQLQGLVTNADYEFLVETNVNGKIGKSKGTFKALSATAAIPESVKQLKDQIVKFTDEPMGTTSSTTMQLRYHGADNVWRVATVKQTADRSVFTWDPTEMLMFYASTEVLTYEYTIKDGNGKILTQATGALSMSGAQPVQTTPHTNYGAVPTYLTFYTAEPNAQYLRLNVRAHTTNASAPYTTQALIPRNGQSFVWDATNWAPTVAGTSVVLDYFYEFYSDAQGTTRVNGGDGLPLHIDGQITLGGTQQQVTTSFLLTGAADTSTTIHRSQSYNAFGEISQQVDGNVNAAAGPTTGNTTHLYYNTMGKLVEKEDPFTAGLSVVGADGTVTKLTIPSRPRSYYAYDLAGRLVATQDANGNRNSLTVVAGFGNNGMGMALTGAEYHADVPNQAAKTIAYDSFGDARIITEWLGFGISRTTQQKFDGMDRLVEVTHAQRAAGTASYLSAPTVDVYIYDQAGQRIVHSVNTTIDSISNTASGTITRSGGTQVSLYEKTFYDSLGRVRKTVDLQGLATSYDYVYDSGILNAYGTAIGGYRKTTTLPIDGSMTGYTYTGPNTNMVDRVDYFGRIFQHTDFGSNTFSYTYNKAGWLIHQSSTGSAAQGSGAQSIDFEYYANGYQKKITDNVTGAKTYYEYDNEGNRTLERYTIQPPTPAGTPPAPLETYQESHVTYDQLNRVTKIASTAPIFDIEYEYDAMGNRLHVSAHYIYEGVPGNTQDFWYRYDKMNRFTVTMGSLIGNKVVATATQGVEINYDWAGQRVQAIYRDATHTPAHKETYTYTADGYLEDTYINADPDGAAIGLLRARRTNDGLGRVTAYEEWDGTATNAKSLTRRSAYSLDSQILVQKEWNGDYSETGTEARSASYVYANTGSIVQLTRKDSTGGSLLTTISDYSYVWWDEAKESRITVHGATPSFSGYWMPGYARFVYDVNGHLQQMNDPAYNPANPTETMARSVNYITDAQGLVLMRDEIGNGRPWTDMSHPEKLGDVTKVGGSDKIHHFFYLNSHGVGDVGNDGMRAMSYAEALSQDREKNNDNKYRGSWQPVRSADFDANYEPITANYPSTTPGTYTVRGGDTLQGIAATLWGDSAMWYLIADANGLTGSDPLVPDQVLTIPNKLANIHNNSGTYRVFDASETLGNTDPTLPPLPLPPPPPRSKKHCGGIGTILIAVVAIIAAVYTAGAALYYFAPQAAAAGAAAGAAGAATATAATAATAVTSMAASGMAALGGSLASMMGAATFGAAFAAGAIGAAVGSIVSQGLGMAMGMQDKFSWQQVGVAAIAGGVTAGLGSQEFTSGSFSDVFSSGIAGDVEKAAVGNMVTQGLSVATGMQEKFSWTQVAAAVAGSAASQALGGAISDIGGSIGFSGKLSNGLFTGTTLGLVNGGLQAEITHQKPNWGEIAAQSFGQSLGNTLIEDKVLSDSAVTAESLGTGANGGAAVSSGYAEAAAIAASMSNTGSVDAGTSSNSAVQTSGSAVAAATSSGAKTGLETVEVDARHWTDAQYRYSDYLQVLRGLSAQDAADLAGSRPDYADTYMQRSDDEIFKSVALAPYALITHPGEVGRGVWNAGVTTVGGTANLLMMAGAGYLDLKGLTGPRDWVFDKVSAVQSWEASERMEGGSISRIYEAGTMAVGALTGANDVLAVDSGMSTLATSANLDRLGKMRAALHGPEEATPLGVVTNSEGIFGARGPISGRPFEPENAGGPIRDLNTDRVKVTDRGIDVVRKHVDRFGQDDANDFMIDRLGKISRGEIPAEQVDLNFYTHELREFVRYRKLGWESGVPKSPNEAYRLWNNTHTATLEDYRLNEKMTLHPLYHPDAP